MTFVNFTSYSNCSERSLPEPQELDFDTTNQEFEFNTAQPFALYVLKVRGFNETITGNYSTEVFCSTNKYFETGLSMNNLTNTSVILSASVNFPDDNCSSLYSVHFTCEVEDSNVTTIARSVLESNESIYEAEVTGLVPFTNYTCNAMVTFGNHTIGKSSPITFKTKEGSK